MVKAPVQVLQDQEILTDALTSQKQISSAYNTYSGECMNQSLKSDMLNILRDEQSMQSAIFGEMHKRGWYEPAAAQQPAINQTRSKFEGIAQQIG
ncbi:MAG: spore coat protein [Oscillospiraceae bacterium]|jgi:spore coat protein CotF|nr:spore coat protein [Oscillospiraceae bacterium]